MNRKPDILVTVFGIFLFLITIWYYASITMFFHAHIVNGHVVYHSHPYKSSTTGKNPFQTHHHHSSEFILIQQYIKSAWYYGIIIPQAQVRPALINDIVSEFFISFIQSRYEGTKSLRAPPAA